MSRLGRLLSIEVDESNAIDSSKFPILLSKFEAKHIFGNMAGKSLLSEYAYLCEPPAQTWQEKFRQWKPRLLFSTANLLMGFHNQIVEERSDPDRFEFVDEYNKEPDIDHLPLTLLPDLVIEEMINNMDGFQSVPVNLRYNAVVLMVDVSGFTPLTEMYNRNEITGTDELAANLNNFMSNVASSIMAFGGDILSFAGDAYLCQWDSSGEADIAILSEKVFECAVYLQTMPQETNVSQVLKVKIGIAIGEIKTLILGSPSEFLLFVITGEVLIDLRIAEESCGPGDIVVSEDVYHCLKARDVEVYETTYLSKGFVKLSSISSDEEIKWPSLFSNRLKLFRQCGPRQMAISRAFLSPVLRDVKTKDQLNYLSEVTRITILFILLPDIDVHAQGLELALQIVLLYVQKYEGVLNKVILFDKGCTFLAAFGLPGLKHLNDAARAVTCADVIITELERVHNIVATTGISSGTCFCGMVGHSQRQEYTVIGWRVNMACRLMTTYPDEPVVLDADTYHLSCNELGEQSFIQLQKRKLKGIKMAPAIYGYCKSRTLSMPKLLALPKRTMTDFFKTEDYMKVLLCDMKEILKLTEIRNNMQLPVITIRGQEGSGRSYLLYHSVEIARNLNYEILAFNATESHVQEPFWSICFILRYFLKLYTLKESCSLDTIRKFIPVDSNPYSFVLNHLLDIKYPVPKTMSVSIETIYYETGQLLKQIFDKLCPLNSPLLIAVDDADCLDIFSWQLLHSLANSHNVILLLSLPLNYLPSCSAAAVICEKNYHETKLENLNKALVAPLVCWLLDVDAVHEDIVEDFKNHCHHNSQTLEELTMMMSASSPFVQIVPKADVNLETLKNAFLFSKTLEDTTRRGKRDTLSLCDLGKDLTEGFDSFSSREGVKKCINTLGIQNRVVLKRAAVLGFTFTRNMLGIINSNLPPEELDGAIETLLQQNIFCLVCSSGLPHKPALVTKKHPSIIRLQMEDSEVLTQVADSQHMLESLPMKHTQKIQFISKKFRNNILSHMTKDQRLAMYIEVANLLEKKSLICISCSQDIDYFLTKDSEGSGSRDSSSIFDEDCSLQLVPLDLRKCNCLEHRTESYELISSIYKQAGMLLLPIKFLVKAAETCIYNNNPTQAISFIEYCFKTFPKEYILEKYVPLDDEANFIPAVLKASLYRVKAQVLYYLNCIYDAASNAIQALSKLGLSIVDFVGDCPLNELPCFVKPYSLAEFKEIAQCLSVVCLTYSYTSEIHTAYRLAVEIDYITPLTDYSFVETVKAQCLYYTCKIKVMLPLTEFTELEDVILNTCHERLISGSFPVDILDIRAIAQAYIAIIAHNLSQRKLYRAERICREAYRVLNCIHETQYTPRVLSLAVEACLHNQQTKLLSIYLSHLRGYAIECNSEVQLSFFYCGTIRRTHGMVATPVQMDVLGQCEDFIENICVDNIPLYISQDICNFIAANVALWCLESKPVADQVGAISTFVRWYQFARKQKFRSYDSYWHMSAELTMIRIDIIIQFWINKHPHSVKKEHFERILNDLVRMKVHIQMVYPVLERTWTDLLEELRYIWRNIFLNEGGKIASLLQNCIFVLRTDMLTFVSE